MTKNKNKFMVIYSGKLSDKMAWAFETRAEARKFINEDLKLHWKRGYNSSVIDFEIKAFDLKEINEINANAFSWNF